MISLKQKIKLLYFFITLLRFAILGRRECSTATCGRRESFKQWGSHLDQLARSKAYMFVLFALRAKITIFRAVYTKALLR